MIRLAKAQWRNGDPEILVVLDAGNDAPRIAHLLGDLPVQILGRIKRHVIVQSRLGGNELHAVRTGHGLT